MPTFHIHLLRRRAYGHNILYPDCAISFGLVKLTKRETFTETDVLHLKNIGVEITYREADRSQDLEIARQRGRKGGLAKAENLRTKKLREESEEWYKKIQAKKKTDVGDLV